MSCLEFRRTVGADPGAETPELVAHAQECVACARYRDELRRMDRLIYRALHIEVGPEAVRPSNRPRWLPRWAAAASIVGASILGALLWLSAPRDTLAEQLVAHIEGEPQSLVRTADVVPAGVLEEVLARSGVRLRPGAGAVSYAMSCWFRGQYVPHLVVQDERGPVTVLLLAQERSVRRPQVFHEQGFHGVVLPAPRGALAVLAQEAPADEVAQQFLEAVEYRP